MLSTQGDVPFMEEVEVIFYLGTHKISHAKHIDNAFISANILRGRKSPIEINTWILDSGAFTEIAKYGKFRFNVKEYADLINKWRIYGNMELAVCQDYMCEPFMLEKTGLTVKKHQRLTIERYDELIQLTTQPILPVLQGCEPAEYVEHLNMYGNRLPYGFRVGVGSVCKRNRYPSEIIEVLSAIKISRPDLRLHGFGVKKVALYDALVCSLLYSADSLAWSYAARREGRDSNSLGEALAYKEKINNFKARKGHQLELV